MERSDSRNTTIDLFRLIATFGVITIHVPFSTPAAKIYFNVFWPFCVPFFYMASLTFYFIHLENFKGDRLKKKVQRLVYPYISWTIIYLTLIFIKHSFTHSGNPVNPVAAVFYGSSAVHLYFLPNLLGMQALIYGIYNLKKDSHINLNALAVLIISIIYFFVGYRFQYFGFSSAGSILAIPLYILIAYWASTKILGKDNNRLLTIIGILIVLFMIVSNFSGFHYILMDFDFILIFGGMGLLLLAIGSPFLGDIPKIKYIAGCSYGIYLSHVLFLETFKLYIERIFKINLYYNFYVTTLIVISIFLMSLLFVILIRKIPHLKFYLFGE